MSQNLKDLRALILLLAGYYQDQPDGVSFEPVRLQIVEALDDGLRVAYRGEFACGIAKKVVFRLIFNSSV